MRDGNIVKTVVVIRVTVASTIYSILRINVSMRNGRSYSELCVPSHSGAPAVRLHPQK
tara:strand:+ start:324 stop:497 length:174 start_codon:yes stop_codon:yes gene_type:complete